jgi:hypothetical protein
VKLALAALALTGCATATDLAFLLGGPSVHDRELATAHGTDHVEHAREIAFDPVHGLVCHDLETPYVTDSSVMTHERYPNGIKVPMQLFTGLEAGVTGTVFGIIEIQCASDPKNCVEDRSRLYLYAIPLFADIAWGIYRSFTIHNPIVQDQTVSYPGNSSPIQGSTLAWTCAVGTEIPLVAYTDTLTVHVGDDGHIAPAELDASIKFMLAFPQFSVGGGLKFDSANVASYLAGERAKLPAPVAQPPTVTTPPPGPPPTVTVPSSVCIETPMAEACVRARPPQR